MPKQMICPICRTANDVEDQAIGSYVRCRNCPHLFWVTVPPLGEDVRDEPIPAPNVVPDYKAWEQQFTSRAQGIEAIAAELRSLRAMLWGMLAVQVITGLLVLALLVLR